MMADDEIEFEEDGDIGTGIEPALMDGQCMSLAQLREAVEITIGRLPDGCDPAKVPVTVIGKGENKECEYFNFVDIWMQFFPTDRGDFWEACILHDGSGEDEELSKL